MYRKVIFNYWILVRFDQNRTGTIILFMVYIYIYNIFWLEEQKISPWAEGYN